ncbi:uncharacterized protein LOC103575125 isoform X2 [Microplitis demolitor]|uniref:uncharacterized protein LOC103575125 isoform X2 n=1 Tax=Microplitis demolitor TaxID=69319 RepID=UPI00235B7002|nr:uncharacterized protein LOC103575125 isoform X2 [Microplitis demolitor]
MVEGKNRERRRRKRKEERPSVRISGSGSRTGSKKESKVASTHKREHNHESCGTRNRRRTNGGSLSSRGSATSLQCGLCAVLTSLFRRAMCIAGSRRGSGESCYQELSTDMQQHNVTNIPTTTVTDTLSCQTQQLNTEAERHTSFTQRLRESIDEPNTEITTDDNQQNDAIIRISEAALPSSGVSPSIIDGSSSYYNDQSSPALPAPEQDIVEIELNRRFSETDNLLLENLNIENKRHRHTGRFLTMHKRRRKKLTTRSLNQDPGLLDDIFHGQVQCMLQRAGHWRFNAFTLETVSGGRSLPVLCVHLFQWYGLINRFNLDVVRVWKLFALIEEGYHSTNPYHNSIHATDVTQAMHCFLQEDKIRRHLTSLEVMASLIAAVTHDLDHPGVNQPFLVATSNHLATLYENTSVLENHHWRSAIGCLLESGVYQQLSPELRPTLQQYISSLILATDITRQQEFIARFKTYLDTRELDMSSPSHRHFILQIALKCADISNPCRPWDISHKWSLKVCEEFFRQGDYERQLNLPVTPLCDRASMSISKIQVGFFEFVVTPLYQEWHRFLNSSPLSLKIMANLRSNHHRWQSLKNSDTPISSSPNSISKSLSKSVTKPSPEDNTSFIRASSDLSIDLPSITNPPSSIAASLAVPVNIHGRRHSVPLSLSKPAVNSHRRESVPCTPEYPKIFKNSSFNKLSSLSLLSTHSAASYNEDERPVSAENLLPEPSIASITSSAAASKLCEVLQPERTTNKLTRQQTFPPLQPCNRTRYMSTTAEMAQFRVADLSEDIEIERKNEKEDMEIYRAKKKLTSRSYTLNPDTVTSDSKFSDRRYSVQSMTGTKPDKEEKKLRCYSVQDATDPAVIYANLTSRKDSGQSNESARDLEEFKEEDWTGDENARDECGPLPGSGKVRDDRRFSTPVDGIKGMIFENRRFTEPRLERVFFIGSPPESPPRKSNSSSSDGSEKKVGEEGNSKRDEVTRFRGMKIIKLDEGRKENVDPRGEDGKGRRMGWARRGSAPVGLMSRIDDFGVRSDRRRGSVPTETEQVTGLRSALGPRENVPLPRRASLPQETALTNIIGILTVDRENYPVNNNNNQGINNNPGSIQQIRLVESGLVSTTGNPGVPLSPRRGSVPADISELRRDYFIRNASNNPSVSNNVSGTQLPQNKSISRNNRKKSLRRRSSGGPEMFSIPSTDDNDNGCCSNTTTSKWTGWKRDLKRDSNIPEPSVKRRGSLPVEMLSVAHSARYNFR